MIRLTLPNLKQERVTKGNKLYFFLPPLIKVQMMGMTINKELKMILLIESPKQKITIPSTTNGYSHKKYFLKLVILNTEGIQFDNNSKELSQR